MDKPPRTLIQRKLTYYYEGLYPLSWHKEQSGRLRAAIHAFSDHMLHGTPFSQEQLSLLRDYVDYYIHAPMWRQHAAMKGIEVPEEMTQLEIDISQVTTAQELDAWIQRSIGVGIDPL